MPADPSLLERDVTSTSVLAHDAWFSGRIVARRQAVVCGLPVVADVFERLSTFAGLLTPIETFPLVAEGARVSPGTPVMEIEGPAAAVLSGERTALDFLMTLSGIATETARWVEAAGPALTVCDTRKTLPGLRALSKYAVTVGGGTNHRMGLYDMVLIKDNHIARAGGIASAVAKARASHPDLLIQVEADHLSQALEAVQAGADMVLLDNMNDAELTSAVIAVRDSAEKRSRAVLIEASGGITIGRLAALRETGVDRVSTSALTMAGPCDFGLDEDAETAVRT
ncbi:MAG: carboxylating nicotinate-nucleotide diphosphorylase [Coriobacteriia bacterium]|nr:carboxylating nicotinate-nucleotide diphosphorylase [Coriobacteriia bacterium]